MHSGCHRCDTMEFRVVPQGWTWMCSSRARSGYGGDQCLGRIWDTIGQHPSVSKSNWASCCGVSGGFLHPLIWGILYIPWIPLEGLLMSMKFWTPSGYFSNSKRGRFSSRPRRVRESGNLKREGEGGGYRIQAYFSSILRKIHEYYAIWRLLFKVDLIAELA